MGKLVRIAKIGFYLGKLGLGVLWALPYFRWRIWRVKHAFKKELRRGGLPDELVTSLVESYNRQNKQVFGLITKGIGNARRDVGTSEAGALELKLTSELK